MKLLEELDRLLQEHFPDARVELELANPGQKVSGFLIWKGFEGLEQIERQNKVWDALKQRFNATEQRRIIGVFTFTPHEWKAMKETFPVTA